MKYENNYLSASQKMWARFVESALDKLDLKIRSLQQRAQPALLRFMQVYNLLPKWVGASDEALNDLVKTEIFHIFQGDGTPTGTFSTYHSLTLDPPPWASRASLFYGGSQYVIAYNSSGGTLDNAVTYEQRILVNGVVRASFINEAKQIALMDVSFRNEDGGGTGSIVVSFQIRAVAWNAGSVFRDDDQRFKTDLGVVYYR